jgi:hypothetical protein
LQRFARSKLHGAIHAECFKRFEAGQSPERVVIELQLPLEEVERIHLGWLRMASEDKENAPSANGAGA